MKKLDAEEQAILTAFEAGEFKSAANAKREIKRHTAYATAIFQKDSRIKGYKGQHNITS